MKKISLALLLSLCTFMAAFAQNPYTIKGFVTDTANNSKLHNASIIVLNAKDSTLYKFSRAAANGTFSIGPIKKGKFILLLTYPEYADYVAPFSLDSVNNSIDFKQINMNSKAKILNEVIIKGQAAAIKIKGDTTEFNARSYTIQPNDKVEDLLKKLPGIQVDAQGKITAQGKTVEKVLVDGEEFFGDDPTLVTKNLRADMVDKVQLFEKKSDQATFTGVDDGQKTQTLNIKLKEDKKQGYFGKVDAGYGTDDFYQIQAMINKFKNKEKIAAYFTSSNTGKTGLSWDDAGRFGASGSTQVTDDGMIFMTGSDELDGGGSYWGEGIPKANSGGLHYENKWDSDKQSINTNYKVGALNVKINKNTLNQNNLPSGIINSNTDNITENDMFRQKLDATYTIKLDTSSNLKVIIDGTLKNIQNENNFTSTALRGDNSLLNTSQRFTTNDGKQQLFNLSALYTRKLKKPGRNYSLDLTNAYSNSNSDGFLKSNNNFFDENSNATRNEVIDQLKENDISTNKLATNFTFNEPLSKFLALVANYGISFSSNNSHRKTFDANATGAYDQLNQDFSNHFEANQLINQVGTVFSYKKGKAVITLGTKASFVNFDQKELYSNQTFNRNFINWLPQASYQYKFSAQKSFSFNYNGSTTQPTVSQLQPVRVNDDPLNIPEGNPLLKPSYNNRLNFYYNTYKVISNQSFYISGSANFTQNQIVSSNITDSEGRTVYKSVNLEDKLPYSVNAYGGFSKKILGSIGLGLNFNAGTSKFFNYVNSQLNATTSVNVSPSLNIYNYGEKNEFYLSFGPRYTEQEASLQKQINNKGWGYSGYLDLMRKLPKKITISASSQYSYQPSSAAFENSFEQLIVNANITKAFFKDETFKLNLSANDILNQNRGFRRTASGNSIVQTSFNNISRYFMFSLIWDFNKMGGTPKTN